MSTYDPPAPGNRAGRARKFVRDAVERVLATAVEAGLAYAAVETADWDALWVPVITAGLAALKVTLAKYTGQKDSASLDPAV